MLIFRLCFLPCYKILIKANIFNASFLLQDFEILASLAVFNRSIIQVTIILEQIVIIPGDASLFISV